MNILTFDIEEWYIEKAFHGGREERYDKFDRYLKSILELLDERQMKATFFCVGRMAVDFPEVVRLIARRGHEIGCHSNVHTWLNKMSRDEALDDTRQAVDALEQLLGSKVLSYRAPAFSIGDRNKWALEVLAQCGIERDASIFPTARDFGGFANFGSKVPTRVSYNGVTMKEFPICTANVMGKELAFSGGGYFRFFPLWFVKREIKKAPYAMCYFHIGDLMAETSKMMTRKDYEGYFKEKGTLLKRYKRHLKNSIGQKGAYEKMCLLIKASDFMDIEQASKQIEWNTTKEIIL